jgi:hypothetical protein
LQVTPYGERIVFEGSYKSIPRSGLPAQTMEDAVARIGDVIGDMRRAGNQYAELRDDADLLEKTLERYTGRPPRLFETCQKVIGNVGALIARGTWEQDDRVVGNIMIDLQNTADDIFSFDVEVKRIEEARERLRWERMSRSQKDAVVMVSTAVAQVSDETLAPDMIEDAAVVLSEEEPTDDSKKARYRLGSRLVRIMAVAGAGGLAALSSVEPAISGAQFLWNALRPLIGF